MIAYYASRSTTWSWHTHVQVTVLTPEGQKNVSIVYREGFTLTSGPLVPAEAIGGSRWVRGEAAAIEVTPSRYLFILLNDLPSALDYVDSNRERAELAEHLEGLGSTSPVTLPAQAYPKLATFKTLADPATAMEVTPKNISAVFGGGVAISSVSLSVTKLGLTCGQTETLLPWLDEYHGKMLDGSPHRTLRTTMPFANSVSSITFRTSRTTTWKWLGCNF